MRGDEDKRRYDRSMQSVPRGERSSPGQACDDDDGLTNLARTPPRRTMGHESGLCHARGFGLVCHDSEQKEVLMVGTDADQVCRSWPLCPGGR
jgi:hypothetical protein